ncbi:cucumber peeling cupredoxin-like [Nymphaea colorata]|nr:cucumber peeling cupredoxin-like [Nymphaea colorata]
MASSKTIVTILLAMAMAAAASAATYTVGDSAGWMIPGTPTFYDKWAASKTFRVNDKLVFNFPAGAHTAVRVSENEYKACTFANPMERYTTSPATVTLNDTGAHYYLCDVTGHCSAGQKVSINVVSAAASPLPSQPTPAPPVAGSAPSTLPTPSSQPTPSAASFSRGFKCTTFLALVLAFTFMW